MLHNKHICNFDLFHNITLIYRIEIETKPLSCPNFDGLKNIISLQPQKESENKNIPSLNNRSLKLSHKNANDDKNRTRKNK